MDAEYFDVIIVGGAVTGGSCAYFLKHEAAFGGSVLVLEQDPGYGFSASARSAASVRHQFSTPDNIRISQFASEFFREAPQRLAVEDDEPAIGFRESGYLFLASAAGESVLRANHAVQRALGAEVMLLDSEALAARFGWLARDRATLGSLGLRGEGWLDAWSLLRAYRARSQALGAVWRQARVQALQRHGRRVTGVRLTDGTILSAGTVVNAAGTDASRLARGVGIELPVQSRKRCVFHFTTPAAVHDCPLVIDPSGVWFRPEGQGFIAGLAPDAAQDPECFDFEVPDGFFESRIWPVLAACVPGFEALRVVSSWAGHYDVNVFDQNVILGPHPDLDGLLFANGFSGHGLQQSPAVGRAMSELITFGTWRTLDLSALGWSRVLQGTPLLERNVV